MTLHIQALGPVIGALVSGITLSEPLPDAVRAELEAALFKHHVLFFENQAITPTQQRDLARCFGPLHVHPIYPHVAEVPEIIVLDTSDNNLPDNDNWHTDVTFIDTPPLGALLSAKLLPPSGGDTLWSSGIAAYEALSVPFQHLLDDLTAEHDILKSFTAQRFARTPQEQARWEEARVKNPVVTHPVVRTHPVSGQRGLFVNEGFTTRILKLDQKESDVVLAYLRSHVAKPEFTVRWRWKENDLAFWDNRLTQHYATVDYLPHRRIMHRATILGDKPY
ncbi:taurine dioxygenase [Rhodoferax sp.]|uniref:taurine dioxygenase n=1 Tax=Rhodoferax sp. TaxID=50421 RepID=UPI002631BF36|nr:taurine dioxygenase [Rhodoferax sp.]MDD2926496.1 taurine dioxygenase [Rhodoferax sp.]